MQRHPWTVLALVLGCVVLLLVAAHEHDPGAVPAHPPAVSHP